MKYKIRQIIKVVDGDTIYVECHLGFGISKEIKLRIMNIDTPEVRTKDLKEKQQGLMCKEYAKELVQNAVWVDIPNERTDLYGRYIGDLVFTDDTAFSATMDKYMKQFIYDTENVQTTIQT